MSRSSVAYLVCIYLVCGPLRGFVRCSQALALCGVKKKSKVCQCLLLLNGVNVSHMAFMKRAVAQQQRVRVPQTRGSIQHTPPKSVSSLTFPFFFFFPFWLLSNAFRTVLFEIKNNACSSVYQVVDHFVNGFHRVNINGVRGHDGTKMKELACENEL